MKTLEYYSAINKNEVLRKIMTCILLNRKMPVWKGYVSHGFYFMILCKRQNYIDIKNMCTYQRNWHYKRGKMNRYRMLYLGTMKCPALSYDSGHMTI